MDLELPALRYDFAALEPHIDARTMELHHDKHHQAYIDKARDALSGTDFANWSVEQILTNLDQIPESRRTAVRNNVGGHANHSLFWEVMGPAGGEGASGPLTDAIRAAFGDEDAFRAAFTSAATGVFGSGWTWLLASSAGLEIATTPNQDSPLMDGSVPILGLDVWEHAYYLKYQNKRPDYIAAWWNVVNWGAVSERFASAMVTEESAAA